MEVLFGPIRGCHHHGEGRWQEWEAAVHIAPGTLRITVLLHPVHADLSPLKE